MVPALKRGTLTASSPVEKLRRSASVRFPLLGIPLQETFRMNPGHTVQDAHPPSPPGQDDASRIDGTAGYGGSARSPRSQKPLQDIQDIIDKLAAVTQQ